VNCRCLWIIKLLNASCAALRQHACLSVGKNNNQKMISHFLDMRCFYLHSFVCVIESLSIEMIEWYFIIVEKGNVWFRKRKRFSFQFILGNVLTCFMHNTNIFFLEWRSFYFFFPLWFMNLSNHDGKLGDRESEQASKDNFPASPPPSLPKNNFYSPSLNSLFIDLKSDKTTPWT
jgi:hypothetical protein